MGSLDVSARTYQGQPMQTQESRWLNTECVREGMVSNMYELLLLSQVTCSPEANSLFFLCSSDPSFFSHATSAVNKYALDVA